MGEPIVIKPIFLIFSLVLLALFVLTVFIKAKQGINRGAYKQLCSLALIILSAAAAFFTVSHSSDLAFELLVRTDMADILGFLESLTAPLDSTAKEVLLSFSGEAVAYLLSIPIAIIAPFLFFLVFIVVRLIFGAVYRFIQTKIYIPHPYGRFSRRISGFCGALEGLLITLVCFIPLMSLLNLAVPIASRVESEDGGVTELAEGIEDFDRSPVIRLLGAAGGDYILSELTTVGSQSDGVDVKGELVCILDLVEDIIHLSRNAGDSSKKVFSSENGRLLVSILGSLEESDYLTLLISDSIHLVSTAVFSGVPEESDEPIERLLISMREFLDGSTKSSVKSDLRTARELFAFLTEEDIIGALDKDTGDAKDILAQKDNDGNTVIKNTVDTLKENPRADDMIVAVNELAVSLMVDSGSAGESSADAYAAIKAGFSELLDIPTSLSDREYTAATAECLGRTFDLNRINMSGDMLLKMAESTGEYIKSQKQSGAVSDSQKSLTDTQTCDILLIYYDLYHDCK